MSAARGREIRFAKGARSLGVIDLRRRSPTEAALNSSLASVGSGERGAAPAEFLFLFSHIHAMLAAG
jgi:hypothetical protein